MCEVGGGVYRIKRLALTCSNNRNPAEFDISKNLFLPSQGNLAGTTGGRFSFLGDGVALDYKSPPPIRFTADSDMMPSTNMADFLKSQTQAQAEAINVLGNKVDVCSWSLAPHTQMLYACQTCAEVTNSPVLVCCSCFLIVCCLLHTQQSYRHVFTHNVVPYFAYCRGALGQIRVFLRLPYDNLSGSLCPCYVAHLQH